MTAIGFLFMLGPLVLVPLGLRLIVADGRWGTRLHAAAIRGSLPAALALGLAMVLPTGGVAGILALPWLFLAVIHASSAMCSLASRMTSTHRAPGWIDAVGATFLVVGAAWIAADRIGYRPLGFDPSIVRLTAVHFHFAGFGLLLVAGRLVDRAGGVATRIATAVVAAGVPLVAIGFLGSAGAGMTGVVLVAIGGLLVGAHELGAAGSMRSGPARRLARIGGVSLFVTMPMAVLWQVGQVVPTVTIDLSTMIRIHGTLNALGFAIPSVLSLWLDRARESERLIALAPG